MRKRWLCAGLTVLAMPVLAQDGAAATEKKAELDFDAGMDIRARYEFKDNWMNKGKTSVNPAYEDYYRLRTRFWGKATFGDDYAAFLRLANEFRDYRNSTGNKRKNEFPDELFIDNLYLDFNNLADRVDLRVGRQDIREGAGRVISDGTPGDGSRSTYFDALFAKVRFLEKSDVDLMATWNRYRDDWTLGNPHDVYDNTKIKSGSPYSKMDEKGLMAYVHYNEIENFPMEFYWIWKQEDRFFDKKTRYPGRDFHTLGTRLMPKINEKLSAEVEAAVQTGQIDSQSGMRGRDILAWMTYAGLTYSEKEVFSKPKLTGAVLWMSGDTDSYYKTQDGSTDTGWNPVFNRTTWFSELCSSMYDQYRWSNLIYPHLEAAVEPFQKHKVKVQCGPMFAHEKDNGATSSYRGLYTQARYDFPLLSKIFGKRGEVKGAVVGEALWYGDYYQHDAVNEDVATWLRFELNGKF
ncbi:MAG TPA: alginate export family protein [Kiritimatiellia bacterium]|nr:alginate export family protein [Kiritimatiellia bacterium]HOR98387.1 alginate export family protein [Kiritimatiellia bacterium]HRU18899.1 alginate export family protein [Kiritimatiellia bacterium]